MRARHTVFAGILVILSALPGVSATLAVTAAATPSGGLYDYSYEFSISGSGASVDNIFLGSNDLSPLDVVIQVDGAATADWSWLGNDTPENYLQFFDFNGTSLGNGDVLDVTFSSALAPASHTRISSRARASMLAVSSAPEPAWTRSPRRGAHASASRSGPSMTRSRATAATRSRRSGRFEAASRR